LVGRELERRWNERLVELETIHQKAEAARRLGLSRSHVAYLVKTGKLEAMQTIVRKARRWRINVESATCGRQPELFEQKTNVNIKEA